MFLKSAFLMTLMVIIIGCGVMNSPKDGQSTTQKGAQDGENSQVFTPISSELKIISISKVKIVANDSFLEEFQSYRLFQTKENARIFFTDLNSSVDKVDNFVDSVLSANIDYLSSNTLYYPIFRDRDCGLKESINIIDNNATIDLKPDTSSCKDADIYYLIVYQIDKFIKNITVKELGTDPVVISNK